MLYGYLIDDHKVSYPDAWLCNWCLVTQSSKQYIHVEHTYVDSYYLHMYVLQQYVYIAMYVAIYVYMQMCMYCVRSLKLLRTFDDLWF